MASAFTRNARNGWHVGYENSAGARRTKTG